MVSAEGSLPAVLVDDIVVRFGNLVAVNGVSFAVEEGEVFGLLGPNGAGKTTTLRVLTTLLRPDSGRALVGGYDTAANGLHVRAAIGYVPQAISVDAALTGIENLEFYARVGAIPRRERRDRIEHAIDAMGLASFVDRLARQLSGGMLRRLEVATALLTRPRVLFLDEPTVGLDPIARRLVWEHLDGLRASEATTIVVTTHQMEEAERECERIAIMDLGRLAAQGTPQQLREEYGVPSLDDVFAEATGHELDEGGSFRDVRRQRRLSRRLG